MYARNIRKTSRHIREKPCLFIIAVHTDNYKEKKCKVRISFNWQSSSKCPKKGKKMLPGVPQSRVHEKNTAFPLLRKGTVTFPLHAKGQLRFPLHAKGTVAFSNLHKRTVRFSPFTQRELCRYANGIIRGRVSPSAQAETRSEMPITTPVPVSPPHSNGYSTRCLK